MPDHSRTSGGPAYATWKVGYIFNAGRTLYLACQYAGAEPVTVKIEKKVESCSYRTSGKGQPAEAHCK